MMKMRSVFWIVAGLTVLGTVLRIVGLNNQLWYDEIFTLVGYVRQPLGEIVSQYSRNNHVLYSVLANVSVNVIGDYPWTLRLPAVVFGVACIPALYLLGVVVTSRLEALLATGFLVVSYHHIWFSQDARGYTTLALWTLISTLCLLRGLRDNRLGWHIAYGCSAALGLYAHLTMGFVVVAQLLASMSSVAAMSGNDTRLRVRRAATGFALAGVISAVLYAPMLSQMNLAWERSSDDVEVQTATFSWAFLETIQSFETVLGVWGVLVGLLLVSAGFWSYLGQSRLIFSLMVLPGFLTMIGIVVLGAPIRPRFFFMLIGFGLLVVVRGAMTVAGWIPHRLRALQPLGQSGLGVVLVGAMMLANISSFGFLYQNPKQDFAGALQFVDATRGSDDAVVTAGLAVIPYRDYYNRTWQGVNTRAELEAVQSTSDRVWMIYSFAEYLDPALADLISDDCQPVRVFQGTLGGGNVVVCVLGQNGVAILGFNPIHSPPPAAPAIQANCLRPVHSTAARLHIMAT